METKTLRMVFGTAAGEKWPMTLRYPKDDLDAEGVETAMQAVIDADIFASGLTDILAAQIIGRTVTDLI
ncbi:MAG: DUF2922 domain-containing protein [Thermovirgaceae bacterium]|jgi:hypothetical protein|nr:DUF2922 domain-containing protein [Synergistota bacterium]NLO56530.1 DUF2922 domain-containing protein [Thermovirga sp.]